MCANAGQELFLGKSATSEADSVSHDARTTVQPGILGRSVSGNEWEVGFGAEEPTQFDLNLNSGSIVLHDGTGFLAGIDETIDLEASPIGVTISDLVANGFAVGGTADNLSISNIIP